MSNAMVVASKEKQQAIKTYVERAFPAIKAALPRHIEAHKFVRVVLTATSKTPSLLECSKESLLLATMQAAALGLEPNTSLGLGYILPYGKIAQFIPGYRGLVQLAIQSGEIMRVRGRVVRDKDKFHRVEGLRPDLVHEPTDEEDDGSLKGVYSIAKYKDGDLDFEYMSKAQVDAIRKRSKSANSGPWVTDYEEMALKTVIRRHCKRLPLSEERLVRALEHQARAEAGEGPNFSDVMDVVGEVPSEDETPELPAGKGSRADDLAARLPKPPSSPGREPGDDQQ